MSAARPFDDVRGSIGWTIIVVGGVVIIATLAAAAMRDSRRIGLAVRTLAVAGWLVVVVVACATGVFLRHRYTGERPSRSGRRGVSRLLAVPGSLLAVCTNDSAYGFDYEVVGRR